MAETQRVRLAAEQRIAFGKSVGALRRGGKLPAHVFGHGESVAIQVDSDTFYRLRMKHLTAGIIDLVIGDNARAEQVIIRHVEHQPRSGKIQHIDFQRVALNEAIHAHIPLHLVGESTVAKTHGGVVMLLLEAIEIAALPDNLPSAIEIDISKIESVDQILHASDVTLPEGVTLRTDATESIAKIQQLRTSDEPTIAAPAAPAPVAES